jgi:catechol 2,3-dioxygenase-like lactoylglutathione lyase family enzyme
MANYTGLSRIAQIAIVVHDTPKAVAFYRDVLGMRLLFEAPPALAFFDCGGVRLMLGPASSSSSRAASSSRTSRTSSPSCRTWTSGWGSSAIPTRTCSA